MEHIRRLRYSTREAANILGISKSQLYRHIERGEIRSHLVDGRRWFRPTDLVAFVDSQEARGTCK